MTSPEGQNSTEELAKVLSSLVPFVRPSDWAREVADVVVAAGWRPPVDGTEVQWGWLTPWDDFVPAEDVVEARKWVEHSYPGQRRLACRTIGPVQEVTE